MPAITVENALPAESGRIRLGLVRAEGVSAARYPEGFEAALAERLAAEAAGHAPEHAEPVRLAARDMLRHGRYKPTGRGKPASEYLARTAADGSFPRINALVDINNLISLDARLPSSLWDLDRLGARRMRFRLGRDGEAFVFNAAGQTLALDGLALGARVQEDADEPVVTPIKDSHATKTIPETRRVAAAIYAPDAVSDETLVALCRRFASWLAGTAEAVETATALAAPGDTVTL